MITDKSGSMFVYVMIILLFLFSFTGVMSEVYRVHSIQAHVEYEIQRAVNIAVEEAMTDSYRQDKINILDTAKAERNLRDYFSVCLGLNNAMAKYKDDALVYQITCTVSTTENPPRMQVSGTIIIPSLYPMLATNIEVPFMVSSRNGRVD
ncbi:hypothetical protein FACS1894208_05250 [Clostridia bacterium]|nr:hypothetical protein FACS1894208_05250 [Clostridia bacterium]